MLRKLQAIIKMLRKKMSNRKHHFHACVIMTMILLDLVIHAIKIIISYAK